MGIILWVETILNSSDNIHAPLTFSITLPSRAKISGFYERALTKCLSALPNLVELNIRHSMTHLDDLDDSYLFPHMLEGCSSRLLALHNDLADVEFNRGLFSPPNSGFYAMHRNIRKLRITSIRIEEFLPNEWGGEIPHHILPYLKSLHVESPCVLRAFRAKPIQTLRISSVGLTKQNEEELVRSPFIDTLTALCMGVSQSTERDNEVVTLSSFVDRLLKCAANLSTYAVC
jgi:hypothetical protein